jgi:hypothetical protein
MLSIFAERTRNYPRAVRRETAPRQIVSLTKFLKIATIAPQAGRQKPRWARATNGNKAHATSTGAQWAPVDVAALQKVNC